MKQNISLKKMLKDRRVATQANNEKPPNEEINAKGGKKVDKVQKPGKAAEVVETPKTDEQAEEEKEVEKVVELTDDELDSLIDDDDKLNLENFTVKEPYLRRECKTHLEPSSILSAKKTFR